jgi:hypothetical protein
MEKSHTERDTEREREEKKNKLALFQAFEF